MKDVAEVAGVSFKTVSRVVNDEAGVSATMAKRVHTAIDQLGYRRNHSAHALRSRSGGGTIGVIHADITNPFSAAVHAAFERHTADRGSVLLAGSAGEDPTRQDQLVETFAERRVDGLVIIPSDDTPGPALQRELDRHTPIVFVDREPDTDADVVMSEHRDGAAAATRHLLDHGHRHIGFLGSSERTFSVQQRRIGFDDAMKSVERGVSTVRTDLTDAAMAAAAVHELFADRRSSPSALFVAQNLAAAGAIRALHQRGLAHEIALVAYDHLDSADVVDPAITTVPQDAEALGRIAAEALFSRIGGDRRAPQRHIVPVSIVPRGSGEIRPQ